MEVVDILVADLFGNLVYLERIFLQELFGKFNPFMVYIGIKAFADRLVKDLAEVGTVVPEKRGDRLQLDIVAVVVIDVEDDVIQDRVARRIAGGVHHHLELL